MYIHIYVHIHIVCAADIYRVEVLPTPTRTHSSHKRRRISHSPNQQRFLLGLNLSLSLSQLSRLSGSRLCRQLGCKTVYEQSQKPRQEAIRGHPGFKKSLGSFLWPPVKTHFLFLIFSRFFVFGSCKLAFKMLRSFFMLLIYFACFPFIIL